MRTQTRWIVRAVAPVLLLTGPAAAAQAPDFNLPDPRGKQVNLKALLKEGPVLLDFWATWCKPCLKAMPKLIEIHEKYRRRGLAVVGVNEDGPRNQSKIMSFLMSHRISFPVALDQDGGVMRRMQVTVLPTPFLIAQDGEIVFRQVGYVPDKEQALIAAVEGLLVAQKSAAERTSVGAGPEG